MKQFELERFTAAQAATVDGYASALRELGAGRKQGHWIWYVMPQLEGLAHSAMSQLYALHGRAETRAYLEDPVLAARLLEIASIVHRQLRGGLRLDALMASDVDARKTVSCMTLFERVASEMCTELGQPLHRDIAATAADVLVEATAQGYPPCAFTLDRLEQPTG